MKIIKALLLSVVVAVLPFGVSAGEVNADPSKSVLIVLSNHGKLGDTGRQTGWHMSEATHIYYPLVEAGYTVHFASPKGGLAPVDESSVKLDDPINKKFFEDKALFNQTKNTLSLEKVNPADYKIVHYVGGWGAMWDFRGNKDVNRVGAAIYESGGIVSAICHGPAALVDLKLSNGEYLVKGKNIATFTDSEEKDMDTVKTMPFLLETALRERGAKVHVAKNWTAKSVIDGRLVTGQNPQSGLSVAQNILKVAKELK